MAVQTVTGASPRPTVSATLPASTPAENRYSLREMSTSYVADLRDVYLYTIDDLQQVIQDGQSSREAAAVDANRILQDEIRRYLSMERAKQVSPVITALREHAQSVRQEVTVLLFV